MRHFSDGVGVEMRGAGAWGQWIHPPAGSAAADHHETCAVADPADVCPVEAPPGGMVGVAVGAAVGGAGGPAGGGKGKG